MVFLKRLSAFLLVASLFTFALSPSALANGVGIDKISASSACLIEMESGRVLYSKNQDKRMPMASTTKVMTAIVALESGLPLDTRTSVPDTAVGVEGSSVYLKRGESVTLEVLLYALMLSSANDAAVAIAYAVSGSLDGFVALMNQRAAKLGLCDTHFTNPHGLYDENHYASAIDLAKIMAHAMKNPDFAKITATKSKAFARDDGTSFLMTNHNRLLTCSKWVIGGKTGFTKKSGRCLVTCAERDSLKLVAVTLNAPDDWNDHEKLYDFGFSNYQRLFFNSQTLKIPVISGKKSEILAASHDISLVLTKNHGDISVTINAPRFLFANVKKGDVVGKVVYSCDKKIIATSPLYAVEDVAKVKYASNPLAWIIDFIKGIFT